jgi:hypothetical protein
MWIFHARHCALNFFYINVDVCELDFHCLFAPFCLLQGGSLVLGGSTEDIVEQYPLFFCALQSVSVVGFGRFVPLVVVDRGGCYVCMVFFKY